jgi:predicted amidophosphoribosyltransferase
VLLVDDVTTTGATLAAARTALLAAGAAEVGALALLRTLA